MYIFRNWAIIINKNDLCFHLVSLSPCLLLHTVRFNGAVRRCHEKRGSEAKKTKKKAVNETGNAANDDKQRKKRERAYNVNNKAEERVTNKTIAWMAFSWVPGLFTATVVDCVQTRTHRNVNWYADINNIINENENAPHNDHAQR